MSLAEWSIATDCGSVHKKRHGFKSHRTPKGDFEMTIKIADKILQMPDEVDDPVKEDK